MAVGSAISARSVWEIQRNDSIQHQTALSASQLYPNHLGAALSDILRGK